MKLHAGFMTALTAGLIFSVSGVVHAEGSHDQAFSADRVQVAQADDSAQVVDMSSTVVTAESALPGRHHRKHKLHSAEQAIGLDEAVKQALSQEGRADNGAATAADAAADTAGAPGGAPQANAGVNTATNSVAATAAATGNTTGPGVAGSVANASDGVAGIIPGAGTQAGKATANGGLLGAEKDQPLFTNSPSAPAVKSAKASTLWYRMLGSLAIALVLFGGGIYGFKRWPGSKKITGRGRMIEVLSQHHMGPKKSLAVVRVAGETCLIGITDNNISILKTLALFDEEIPKDVAASLNASIAASATSSEMSGAVNAANKKGSADKAGTRGGAGVAEETLGQKFQKTLAAKFNKSADPGFPASYTRGATPAVSKPESEEEFSMQGLREIVGEKLKTMKEL